MTSSSTSPILAKMLEPLYKVLAKRPDAEDLYMNKEKEVFIDGYKDGKKIRR